MRGMWAAATVSFVAAACARNAATPAPDHTVARAAALAPALAMESDQTVIRFGTPASEVHESDGFERAAIVGGSEPSTGVRRRAEIRLRLPAVDARTAVLDLDIPADSPYRALRVLLNGHRVARLELVPGRRRYAFPLTESRQLTGGNALTLVFGALAERPGQDAAAPGGVAARLFGLVLAPPSPGVEAIAAAPLPFSTWAEGDDLVQAGPSRVSWVITVPPEGRLRFRTAARHGRPAFDVIGEDETGASRPLWHGGPGEDAVLDVPGRPGERMRLWLGITSTDGAPAWGTWKLLRLTGVPAATPAPPPAIAASRPRFAGANVLVIILDAAGARHFGCYGHSRPTTPNIDRIAAEGIVFERAYTPAVFTRSAMASVWTSQLPDEHHGSVSYDEPLPVQIPTLAAAVSASGILTAGFVGNNMAGTAFGLDRGFSEFYRLSYRAEVLREYLFGWLSRNAPRRFLAYVHYREPHYPFDPRPPFDTRFGPDAPLPRSVKTNSHWLDLVNEGSHHPTPAEIDHLERLYDGNLAAVDEEIGRMRRRLEDLGAWERTVVIVSADHGEAMYEHGFVGHNEQVYEDSVHIPLVIRFPEGTIAGGRRVRSLASLIDVAPTIADILGIPGERIATFRGKSLLAAAAGDAQAGADGVLSRTVGSQPRYAWTGPRYKYLYNTRDGDEELYDLGLDPGERTDLLRAKPVAAAYSRQRLFEVLQSLPGRARAGASGWSVPADQRESLRALGYVQ